MELLRSYWYVVVLLFAAGGWVAYAETVHDKVSDLETIVIEQKQRSRAHEVYQRAQCADGDLRKSYCDYKGYPYNPPPKEADEETR